jgi:hypothetical protein
VTPAPYPGAMINRPVSLNAPSPAPCSSSMAYSISTAVVRNDAMV